MIKFMKRLDGKAFSIEIHFIKPILFNWLKEFNL